ncbi:MAG: peptide/nickel transport system substrate-binding protein, partial [Frankiaceae bacterium]|nr:peptide/nickel transport system substrate-binding protein [Frankiaceae bacterium]
MGARAADRGHGRIAAAVLGLTGLVLGGGVLSGCTKVDLPSSSGTSPGGPATSGSPAGGSQSGGPVSPAPGTPSSSGKPVPGGVLKLVGGHDIDVLDFTTSSTPTQSLLHGLSRQLVSYAPSSQFSDVVGRVVPDAATDVPLPVDGTIYTFTLRAGVAWDLTPSRAVTSSDFARGIKRQCNPVAGGVYASYFTEVIAGLAEFCAGFSALTAKATANQISAYMETHVVAGLATPDDRTLVVTLKAPAADFLNMMALTAASAVPVESMAYLPGSPAFRANFVSDGPYKVGVPLNGATMTLV